MSDKKRKTVYIEDLAHFSPKQIEAYKAVLKHRYTLYGGAMAGGKSYWLRWALILLLLRFAQQGHQNVVVALFCENFPTLKDRQLSKIATEFPAWLGALHNDHKNYGRCYILNPEYGGGVIAFRNLDDASKYQSAEFAAIAIDELTKNTREVFEDLKTRLRWPGITETKMLAATNPGSIGHAWVKKQWIDKAFEPNETEQDQYVYVKALAADNPHIPEEYLKQLESLPADKRKAFLEGDWDLFKGQYFSEWRREIHVCEPFRIPDDWRRFASMDYGYYAPSAIGYYAMAPDGTLYLYREIYVKELTYSKLAEEYVSLCHPREKIEYIVADPAIWAERGERDDGLSGAEVFINRVKELTGKAPYMIKGDNARIIGWNTVREWLRPFHKDEKLTARFQVFSTCAEFIRTFPSLVHDEHRPEDCDTDGEDHHADQLRYAIMSRPRASMTPEQVAEAHFRNKMKKKRI